MEEDEELLTCKCGGNTFNRTIVAEVAVVTIHKNKKTGMLRDEAHTVYETSYEYHCIDCGKKYKPE